jgi:hypothetical protein
VLANAGDAACARAAYVRALAGYEAKEILPAAAAVRAALARLHGG